MNNLFRALAIIFLMSLSAQAATYEPHATTIKKQDCDVWIIIQIGVETDTLADIAMIQQAADQCFSISCDLPCEDRTVGKCKVFSKVVVVDWSKLPIQERSKFHHVRMLPGSGVSYVDFCGTPNTGKASGGGWHRHEYSPSVYCHEILHLAGLPDRYRDCRKDRVELGVDNCKDGKKCTPEQIEKGLCPSCDGHEHDCMGSDVTKPVDCNSNFMEVVRMANDVTFICSEECCKKESRTDPKTSSSSISIGVTLDAGLGYYRVKHKDFNDDKFSAYGGAFSVGGYGQATLTENMDAQAGLKLNYTSVSGKQTDSETTPFGTTTYENHYGYRFMDLSIAAALIYRMRLLSLYAGPEVAFILMAKSRQYGTTTYNGVSQQFGDKTWHKINDRRNVQLGLNIGAMYQLMLMDRAMWVGMNFYYPFTNYIAFQYYKNRLYNLNLALMLPLLYLRR